jgi:hypothetical protein
LKYKSAAPNKIQVLILWIIAWVTNKNKFANRKLIAIGELANFQQWVLQKFPSSQLFLKREQVWTQIINLKYTPLKIIELGVAWGYTTNYFLEASKKKNIELKIDAFDLFTGLPEKWRNQPENTFSNHGKAPAINDERVNFHIGNVSETIRVLNNEDLKSSNLLVLFDLDLLEPSLASYQYLKHNLKINDVLFFDEAFDLGERTLINDYLLRDFDCKSLGHTAYAISLQIIGKRKQEI